MEVHGDDVVAAGGLQHVGHQFRGDGRAALVLFVLTGVGEVGEDGGDAAGGGGAAGVDEDEELHYVVVDVARFGGLDDEDWGCFVSALATMLGCLMWEKGCTIFVPYGFADGYAALVVGVLQYHHLC